MKMSRNSISKRSVVAISLGLLALTAIAVAPRPGAAHAKEEAPFKGTFTVQAELITTIGGCAPGDSNCSTCLNNSSIYVEAQGIGDTSLGALFGEVLKCFNPAAGSFGTYSGTLTMTAPNGKDSLTWAYSGQNYNAGDFYRFGPFSGKLAITGGTGKFADAQGSASFTATAGPATAGPSPNTLLLMAFYSVQGKLGLPGND
jgi:hypothetical protein